MDITLAIRAKNLANPARLKESIEHDRYDFTHGKSSTARQR
jgi:hypothetical protein